MDHWPVLVLTCADDPTSDAVIRELNRQEVPVVRFDPGADFPTGVSLAAQFDAAGMSGVLATASRTLRLEQIRSVYYRRPTPYRRPDDDTPAATRFTAAQAQYGLGGVLAGLDCLFVNHPWRVMAAEYKPRQLVIAAECGFRVPPTLITNQVDEARRFATAHGPVVYKTLRDVPCRASDERWCTVWVEEIDPGDLDESVAATAHLFQARVHKRADLRLTVIGEQMFCVRVDSPLLDWRADYGEITYSSVEIPSGVAEQAHAYLKRFGLAFGAFDLALADDGIWFYECNPNGQWAWLEDQTGQPMTRALASLLKGSSH